MLLRTGVPMNRSAPGERSRVAAFQVGEDTLAPAGSLVPPRIKLLSTLRALPEVNGFVTGACHPGCSGLCLTLLSRATIDCGPPPAGGSLGKRCRHCTDRPLDTHGRPWRKRAVLL